jgi:outer membrane protein TolC
VLLTEKLTLNEPAKTVVDVLPNNRNITLYQLEKTYAEIEQKKSGAAFLPEIGFSTYLGYNQFRDKFNLSFNPGDWRPNNYLEMTVKIPVFNGFANKSKYTNAKIASHMAAKRYQDEIRKESINDSILHRKSISSRSIAVSGEKTFHLSGQNLKLAENKYRQGIISLGDYLNVFDDYLLAESQYLNSLSDFLSNNAIIESRK